MPGVSADIRPAWVDDRLFPFESRFVEVEGNTIHYIDEGDGPTVLMYHGNPTWSFVYRGVIEGLRSRYRCVAFDYPGFGLSTPSTDFGYSIREFIDVSASFVDQLDLNDVVSFVQDWGGPIGLSVAARNPSGQRALIIGNTFAWPADRLTWKLASALLGGPVGRLVIDHGNFLARTVGRAHLRRNLPVEEARHYVAPFPTPERRRATRRFIDQVRKARPELEALALQAPRLAMVPSLLLWGTEDSFYGERDLERLQGMFRTNTVHILEGAGHFIQSDAPEEITEVVSTWLSTLA